MPPSKFEANPTLRRGVKRASFSLFTLASSCANAYFRAYAVIDFFADRLVFLNTVTYRVHPLGLMDSTYRVPLLDSKLLRLRYAWYYRI